MVKNASRLTLHASRPVLIIGGSDPSGGAGVQADLFTLQQLGVPALSVITAVTAQTEEKFFSYECVSPQNFKHQLESVSASSRKSLVKIGMLGTHRLIGPLIVWLKKFKPPFVILDPVFRSSTGKALLDPKGIRLLKEKLLPLTHLVMPNLSEAEILSGLKISNVEGMRKAGRKILDQVKGGVLIKGGHLKGPAVDFLITKTQSHFFSQKRISGKGAHGTGCTLASALAGFLTLGFSLKESVIKAQEVVLRKLFQTRRLG